ncbi:MAG: hypothetical protein ACE5JM_16935, partial [Armatimonadota bacterium]
MARATAAALVLTGLMAGVAQVLMARELLDVFYGDEICVGLLLGSWLLWVAIGSAVAARIGGRDDDDGTSDDPPVLAFGILMMVAPLLLIGQIACARGIPAAVVGLKGWVSAKAVALPWLNGLAKLLPGTEGELIGLVPMIACIVVVMAPVCVVEGMQFVLGCRVYARARRRGKGGRGARVDEQPVPHAEGGGEAIGRAYVWDAVGHLGAGGLLSFALVYRVSGMTHAALAGVAAAAGALWLLWAAHQEMEARRFRVGAVTATRVLIVLLVPTLAGWMERIDGAMMRVRWRGQELVAHVRTPYGSLAVTRRGTVHS